MHWRRRDLSVGQPVFGLVCLANGLGSFSGWVSAAPPRGREGFIRFIIFRS